jgi:diaminopropionate ammonia-lyase
MRAARDRNLRQALQLNQNSRILLINTEGATDPVRYRELVEMEA